MIRLVFCVLLSISSVAFGVNSISPNVIGDATKTEDAPWMVSLQIEKNDFAYCGASIIKSSLNKTVSNETATCSGWIVTAASCLKGVDTEKIIVTLGNLNLEKQDKNESSCEIVEAYPHEKHNETSNENDIGLIHVLFNRTTDDTNKTKHLCDEDQLPVLRYWPEHSLNETDYPRINASIYGWGLKQEIGPLQKDLYNTSLPLKTDKECTDDYGIDIFKPMSMICAGGQGRGPCSYDTGGPLTCQYKDISSGGNETTHRYLCGIASFGYGCGSNSCPAVFTDVVNFEKWIDETVAKHSQTTRTATL